MAESTTGSPRAVEEACTPCRGLGVITDWRRPEAADCCDRCAGTGTVVRLLCQVALLTGDPCGERLLMTMYRHDRAEQTHGCINGHRWLRVLDVGAWSWRRGEDVGALEVVA